MSWSAKAQELLRQQYAPTGAAPRAALPAAVAALSAAHSNQDVAVLLDLYREPEEVANLTANDHVWHTETLARICQAERKLLLVTPFQVVDLTDKADHEKGIRWSEELTIRGEEGMVVKPLDFVARGRRGLVQPAVKIRGREYLRIIYGPEYIVPENLQRLKSRGLGTKRSLAIREFALGVEGLERFIHQGPLRRVHECVFGVLALESEPVDPRL